MAADTDIDYEQALLDPRTAFGDPQRVLDHPGLDIGQRRKLLEQWRLDETRLIDSAGENMAGGEEAMLDRVNAALLRLDA